MPRARGDAARIRKDAEAYRTQVVNLAHGEADAFDEADEATNALLSQLGSTIQINDDDVEEGDQETFDIDSSPLTAGVFSFGYNWPSTLDLGDQAVDLGAVGGACFLEVLGDSVDVGLVAPGQCRVEQAAQGRRQFGMGAERNDEGEGRKSGAEALGDHGAEPNTGTSALQSPYPKGPDQGPPCSWTTSPSPSGSAATP